MGVNRFCKPPGWNAFADDSAAFGACEQRTSLSAINHLQESFLPGDLVECMDKRPDASGSIISPPKHHLGPIYIPGHWRMRSMSSTESFIAYFWTQGWARYATLAMVCGLAVGVFLIVSGILRNVWEWRPVVTPSLTG